MPHGQIPSLSKDLTSKINLIARADGAWYEGDGADKKYFDVPYKGSWDNKFAKSVKGYPIEFLFVLFSNVKENHTTARITDSSRTIFQAILGSDVNYFKDRDVTDSALTEFLSEMNMLAESKKPATERNVEAFLAKGEDKMWGGKEPHQFARSAERWRNKFLLAQPDGAYFMGAGHLPEILSLAPSLRMLGGEKAK